jgi:hypothetical protein
VFNTITYFGALILPIIAKNKVMIKLRRNNSMLNPQVPADGDTNHKTSGIYQTWWNVVINLNLVVSGQIIYFATPITNFLFTK